MSGTLATRVFCKKRLQTIENKENECEKERKEKARACNSMKTIDLPQRHRDHRERQNTLGRVGGGVTPPGNSDGYQNKEVAGKAIRKNMKTKGEQIG
jgi:hypothetical protein